MSDDDLTLLRIRLRGETDVFALRHSGRSVAAAVGFDGSNQTRVATALSEVGRVLLAEPQAATGVFRAPVIRDGVAMLEIRLSFTGPAVPDDLTHPPGPAGLAGAARLVDDLQVERHQDEVVVTLLKRLPAVRGALNHAAVRAELASLRPTSPTDELSRQNQELVAALEEAERSRDAQMRMNAELEETNRGVMALYGELTEELEHTNQGVVALYAELEDRSQRLRDANEAKTRFLRHVNHELRAPVNSILGLIRVMTAVAEPPLGEEQQHQIELMRHSASDLLRMVNDLLDLAKAEATHTQPAWEDVDLRMLLGQLRAALTPLLTRTEVVLEIADLDPPPALVSDPMLVAHVLRNLLTNALKYTLSGAVTLEVRAGDDTLAFVVADTGIGIAPEHQDRVFEEFYQVPGPVQAQVGGTGLGLPLVRRLVTALGGTLTLHSEPGVGTTVTVELPREPHPSVAVEAPGDPMRIVIVDDDPTFRRVLRSALEAVQEGPEGDERPISEIAEVADPREALAVIRRLRPHVIFLDLRMPEVSGEEVLAELHDDPLVADIPVIVVTSETSWSGPVDPRVVTLSKTGLEAEAVRSALRETQGQG